MGCWTALTDAIPLRLGVGRRELRRCLCICIKEFNMERSAQFCDGERVDSSTGIAERLDAVKCDCSRCRRAETTAARREAKCERERRRRSCETVEQTAARRATDRSRSNRRRSAETPQQPEAKRAADRCYSARNARITSAVLATAIPFVRLSVCLSVTRRYCFKTTARSTLQFAPLDSKMCLVL